MNLGLNPSMEFFQTPSHNGFATGLYGNGQITSILARAVTIGGCLDVERCDLRVPEEAVSPCLHATRFS